MPKSGNGNRGFGSSDNYGNGTRKNARLAKARKTAKANSNANAELLRSHQAAVKYAAVTKKEAAKAARELAAAAAKSERVAAAAEKEAAKAERALVAAAAKSEKVSAKAVAAAAAVAAVPCVGVTCRNGGQFKVEGSTVARYMPEQCTRVCPPGSTTPFCKICQKQSNAGTLHGRANVLHPSGAVVLRPNSHIRDPLANRTQYSDWNVTNIAKADARAAKAAAPKTAKKGTAAHATNTPTAAGGPAGVPNFNFE